MSDWKSIRLDGRETECLFACYTMTRINRFNGASIRKGLDERLSDSGLVQRIWQPLTGLSPFDYLGGLPSLVLCPLSRIEEDGTDCWRGPFIPGDGCHQRPG